MLLLLALLHKDVIRFNYSIGDGQDVKLTFHCSVFWYCLAAFFFGTFYEFDTGAKEYSAATDSRGCKNHGVMISLVVFQIVFGGRSPLG